MTNIFFLDAPSNFEVMKTEILKESTDIIEITYIKAQLDIDALSRSKVKNETVDEIIDTASKTISDSMIFGMKKLAALVDVDYFDILPQVFGDDEAIKSEDGQKVFKEVAEIYEKGKLRLG